MVSKSLHVLLQKKKKSGAGPLEPKDSESGKNLNEYKEVPEKRWGFPSAGKQNKVLAVKEAELRFQLKGPISTLHALSGMSNLSASLSHTGRRVVLGHTLNTS